jgi:polar amino acid transport system substrate-binding protein
LEENVRVISGFQPRGWILLACSRTTRRKTIAFVDYMRGEEAIVARKSSGIHGNSYAALCGRVVSVEAGTTELDGLKKANQHCGKKITIRNYTHDTDAFEALISSRSQAYAGDYVVAAQYVREHAGILKLAGKIVPSGRPYGIGLLKSNPALKVALQHAFDKIRASGKYNAILTKWHVGLARL